MTLNCIHEEFLMKIEMKIMKSGKNEREHQCRKTKCQYGCRYKNGLRERNIQKQYVMPYIRGYERIHGKNKFAVYKWDSKGRDITTEIKLGKAVIKKWKRLEEPLDWTVKINYIKRFE